MKLSSNDIILAVLGLVLLVSAGVIGYQLVVGQGDEAATVEIGYEVLEPVEWVGEELPILEHVDIGDRIKAGNWLILLYHHDCPDCLEAIAECERLAGEVRGNEEFLQIALIDIPPYGHAPIDENTNCT